MNSGDDGVDDGVGGDDEDDGVMVKVILISLINYQLINSLIN